MVPILSRLFLHRGAVDSGSSSWPHAQGRSFRSAEQQPSKATALSNTMALADVNGKCSPQLTHVNAVLKYLRNFRTWSLTRGLVALEVGLERLSGPPPCPLCFWFLQDVIKSEVPDAHSCGHT